MSQRETNIDSMVMMMQSGGVERILSFAIELIDDEACARLQQQLEAVLHEDPALRVEVNVCEEGLIVVGEDELQLIELRGKIPATFGAKIGELKIRFKETVRKPADAEGKYIRQTGGAGNYGHCKLRIEPNERGRGYEFIDDIRGGVVPKGYIKAIEQGVRGALELGIVAGYPMVDVKVTLFDGSYHEADSNEMAFRFAGSMAFKEAAKKASPVVLEPVMAAEVTTPVEFMGTIIGDINSRRGRIEGMEHTEGGLIVRAMVPLAEVLSSSAHGRPRYRMRFAGYEPAPWRGGDFGDDAAAFAKKPRSPKSGAGSAAAELE